MSFGHVRLHITADHRLENTEEHCYIRHVCSVYEDITE